MKHSQYSPSRCMGCIAAVPVSAQDDGQTAFNNNCRTCHTMKEGDNRQGPSLAGVVGRKAGIAAGLQFFGVDEAIRYRLGRGQSRQVHRQSRSGGERQQHEALWLASPTPRCARRSSNS